jgi:hypothetical protein
MLWGRDLTFLTRVLLSFCWVNLPHLMMVQRRDIVHHRTHAFGEIILMAAENLKALFWVDAEISKWENGFFEAALDRTGLFLPFLR